MWGTLMLLFSMVRRKDHGRDVGEGNCRDILGEHEAKGRIWTYLLIRKRSLLIAEFVWVAVGREKLFVLKIHTGTFQVGFCFFHSLCECLWLKP